MSITIRTIRACIKMYKTCSVYSMPGVLWIKNRDFLIVIFLIFLSYSWWFLSFKFFGDSSSFTQFFCVQHLNYNHFCEKNGEKKEKERNQTSSDLALWWWFQLIDAFFVILFFQCFDLVLMKININRQILFLHLNVRFIEKKEKNNMIFFHSRGDSNLLNQCDLQSMNIIVFVMLTQKMQYGTENRNFSW